MSDSNIQSTAKTLVQGEELEDTLLDSARIEYHISETLDPQNLEISGLAEILLGEVDSYPISKSPNPLWPGTEVGRYRVVESVGRGGMGCVYKVVPLDDSFQEELALKVLSPTQDDDEAVRFETEAVIGIMLKHPGLVRVVDSGSIHDLPYFVMDYVGPSLSLGDEESTQRLRPHQDIARIVATISRAVEFAHSKGVLHRDIKPANIVMNVDGQPKLIDWGLARTRTTAALEDDHHVMGTPQYMSPEQCRGTNSALDERTDVYSLGASLYRLLSGKHPYTGETPFEIMEKKTKSDPLRVSHLNPDIPDELATITMKAMARERNDRYQTAGALADDLENFVRSYEQSETVPRRSKTGLWVGLAFVAALAAGAVVHYFGNDNIEAPQSEQYQGK